MKNLASALRKRNLAGVRENDYYDEFIQIEELE